MLCAQRLYYGRDQLDCPSSNGLNHYLPMNKTGAHSTGERFRATMALLFGIDKLVKRCLLRLKYAIFIRVVALFTCMKQQSKSLQIAFIFISDCDACLEFFKLATDYPIYYCIENNGTSLSNELKNCVMQPQGSNSQY